MRLRLNASFRFLRAFALPLGTIALCAPDVRAQTDQERAGARAAANQGVSAYEAGNYAEALSFLERAEGLVHALPHLLYIARCHEKLGNLVQAREAYLKIGRERLKPTDPEVFQQTQVTAAEELRALDPRVPNVTVNVEGARGAGLTVTLDGEPFAVELLGVPAPMNPGQRLIEAKAPGTKLASQRIAVAEGSKTAVLLKLEPSGEAPVAAASGASAASAPSGAPQADQGNRPVPAGVYIGLAATGAFAIGAGVVGALALGNKSDFDEANDGSDPANAEDLRDSGATLNLLTDVLIAGAVVSAGATAYFYFTRPTVPAARASNGLRVLPVVLPGALAVSASGRF
jgi:hypothetical protein